MRWRHDHLVLGQADKDRITTARLVQELIDIPDSRWGTYGRNDKPITTAQVTRLLKPYGIKSGSVRIPKDGGTTPKGYPARLVRGCVHALSPARSRARDSVRFF